ncbi:MAG TPA: CAP domain-containing protein [Chitinophagaceae bacterium]|nr:CAP domain-containing protein [Chitinophagaceae bacterium]
MKKHLPLFFIVPALFLSLTSFSFVPGNSLVGDVLSHTNQFRRSHGLSSLVMRDDLNAIARKHSENMARGRIGFGHSGFDKRYRQVCTQVRGVHEVAENVAYGARSGKEVVKQWKNSPGHRRNMLGKYKYIGIGTAKDRRGNIYYTQVFAG